MTHVRHRGAEIRHFILEQVEEHPRDIVARTAQAFGMSRQGVHRHLQRLVQQHTLAVEGTTRNRRYTLRPRVQALQFYPLIPRPAEDRLWTREIRPLLGELSENVLDMLQYGFTEMMNNAIEHSAGRTVGVSVTQTALATKIVIFDDGEGIFKKLQRELGLEDERHAVLELGKGKVTTDPARHTGEGIFFTSRIFDEFTIFSGNVSFAHARGHADDEEGIDFVQAWPDFSQGTAVFLTLSHMTSRTTKEVFDRFTFEGDYSFSKTVVPVHLALYGDEKLVSRSQAKRLLAGLDRFKVVLLDFTGVETIGQAFADETFRVFVQSHPRVELLAQQATTLVEHMIRRAAGPRGDAILRKEEA